MENQTHGLWSNMWLVVSDLIKSGAKAIGKAAPVIYDKAEDVAKTLYNNAKDISHQKFQVLSNPLTIAAMGIGGYCSDLWPDQVLDLHA